MRIFVIRGGFCPHFTAVTYVLLQIPPQHKWQQLSSAECRALDQIWFVLFRSALRGPFPQKVLLQLLSSTFIFRLFCLSTKDLQPPIMRRTSSTLNPLPSLCFVLPWHRPRRQAVDLGHHRVFMTHREQLRAPALWIWASSRMRALLCC